MFLADDSSREKIKLKIVHLLLSEKTQQLGSLVLLSIRKNQLLDNNFLASLTKISNHLQKDRLRNRYNLSLQDEHLQHIKQMLFYLPFFKIWIKITPHPLLLMTLYTKLHNPPNPKQNNPRIQTRYQCTNSQLPRTMNQSLQSSWVV